MLKPAEAIELYIRAKDQHQPALIADAFDPAAIVRIDAETDAISFPPVLSGMPQIEKVLVQDFAQAWQEVRTFCFSRPRDEPQEKFSCQWMVAMRSRHGDGGRLGYGNYHWVLSPVSGQVSLLEIQIDEMLVIAEQQAASLITWSAGLPYPWCSHQALVANAAATGTASEAISGAVDRFRLQVTGA